MGLAKFKTVPKIVAVGQNYLLHAKEMGAKSIPKNPILFLKAPTSVVIPPEPVKVPSGVVAHYEVELGLVISRMGKNIPKSKVTDHIEGFFCGIDVTARNLQLEAKSAGSPWSVAKGFDTFLPVSEQLPLDKAKDLNDLNLYLKVDGEMKQQDSTKNMIHSVEDLVSYISSVMTLQPGDLILTGTPSGVGEIVAGNVVEAGIKETSGESHLVTVKVAVEDDTDTAYRHG